MSAEHAAFRLAARRTRARLGAHLVAVLLVQGLCVIAVVPAIGWMFDSALGSAGVTNVTDQTLGLLLLNPLAALLLLGIAVLALAAVLVQLAAVIAIADRQHDTGRAAPGVILRDIGRALRTAWWPSLPLLAAYLLLLPALGGIAMPQVITHGIAVPPFITREYYKAPLGAVAYTAAVVAAVYLSARLIYTMPLLVVARCRPLAAMRRSLRMTRRRTLHVLAALALPSALALLVSSGFSEALIGFVGLEPAASNPHLRVIIAVGRAVGFVAATGAAVIAITTFVDDTRAALSAGTEPAMPAPRVSAPRVSARHGVDRAAGRGGAGERGAGLRGAVAVLVALALVGGVSLVTTPAAQAKASRAAADALVFAHRGDYWGGVENTIGALEAAAQDEPDYVEVDVQQTSDGVWVASHDDNLLVLAGVNENISDMTAAEVTSTVVHQHGFSDTIPTMAEYVTRAQQLGVKLLIEIKVHGTEQPGFVEDFLSVLDGLGVTDDEMYHSLDADVVDELKELRPELTVGLTIAISAGGVPDCDCDFFSIEQASFSDEFLTEAHRQGKDVYVWTVNDFSRIRDLLRMPVDGIITDYAAQTVAFRTELSDSAQPQLTVEDALESLSLFP
ncbi:MAG: glycerophosphodiester phosphodiesterase [Microbacteriaceae bacterium]